MAIPITVNASDADGETLAFTILTGPGHGTLTGSGPSYTYQPTGLYTGPDVFTYKVTDAAGAVASATVTITVSPGVTPTQIEVHPATVTKPLIGDYRYKNLSATLRTNTAVPIPGMKINFKVKGGAVCSAITDAAGTATCTNTGPRQDTGVYTATFTGTAHYLPSSGTGVLTTS